MKQLNSGIFLFKNVLKETQIQQLINVYDNNQCGFYRPVLSSGSRMSLKMNCLGHHWDAKDYKYYNNRTDVDGEAVKKIPQEIIDIAKPFSLQAFPNHIPNWDICIINHYNPYQSKLGMHRDNSESKEMLEIGHPIVSFSIGASCLFTYGPKRNVYDEIKLDNGDVLLMGNENRLYYLFNSIVLWYFCFSGTQ